MIRGDARGPFLVAAVVVVDLTILDHEICEAPAPPTIAAARPPSSEWLTPQPRIVMQRAQGLMYRPKLYDCVTSISWTVTYSRFWMCSRPWLRVEG